MRTLVLLILTFTAALAAPAADEISPFIIGGVDAIHGEFPFIVSLQWVILGISQHMCGGAIIGSNWVRLT